LLQRFKEKGPQGKTLLDIGGGIGAIQHELIPDGLQNATHADASSGYLEIAKQAAVQRGHENKITYRHGDFLSLDFEREQFDWVTLDRVICCYPDMESLVQKSIALARQEVALVYPRDGWGIQAGVWLGNAIMRLFRKPFRGFVHPVSKVRTLMQKEGLKKYYSEKTLLWHVEIYERV